MYDRFRWTAASARRNRLTREYEPLQPFFLLELAKKAGCKTFLDVGANIGAYSLFATLAPTVQKIVAFEADPETSRELRANVALNELDNVIEIQAKAVSSAPGRLSFGIAGKFSGASGVIDTSIHSRSTFSKEVTVEAITLDELFPEPAASPLCIKIDVEGHESAVIDGARAMLTANKAVIQVEGYEEAGGSNSRKLEELGYFRLTAIGPDHYFSNLELLRDPASVIAVYERALQQMIAFNNSNKPVVLELGDFAVQLSGGSAAIARNLKRRIRS